MRFTGQRLAVCALIAALIGLVTSSPGNSDEPKVSKVRFGLSESLFKDNPEAKADKPANQFITLLKEQTGLDGEIVQGLKRDDLCQQLKDNKIQLGILQGYEYAWVHPKNPDIKPLMIAVNQKPTARAVIVVRDDKPGANISDLKGKSLAVPRRVREHCHLFLERRSAEVAKSPKDLFGKLLRITTPEEAIDAVVNGQVDAALADDAFLDWYKSRKPARFARLKVIEKSAPFPSPVITYRAGGLDDATLDRLRKGMLSAKDNPRGVELMKLCQVTSFEPVPDDYDKQLTEIAKAYPAPAGEEKK